MSEIEEKEVLLEIPNLNWPSWETLVSAALEGIAGVNRYEVNAMRRETRVFYDPSQLDRDSLIDQLKKKTRYRSMSIKGWLFVVAPKENAGAAMRCGQGWANADFPKRTVSPHERR